MPSIITDAFTSTTSSKLWSEIEVSEDEFQVEPEAAREALLQTYMAPTHSIRAETSVYGSARRRGGNRRDNGRLSPKKTPTRPAMCPSRSAAPLAPPTPDAPRKRRFAGISSLDVLLDWPGKTSLQKEAAAPPLSSTQSSTSIPSSNDSAHDSSDPHNSLNSDSLPDAPPCAAHGAETPEISAHTDSLPKLLSRPETPSQTALKSEPQPETHPPPKATDSCPPPTLEGRKRDWDNQANPDSPETQSDHASEPTEAARPLEGHMTEEDGDVIFHEPFEIWYTLPSGGARKGINKEVYEGGMHKIGAFTRVSEFFEFHRMLDWKSLPPNSVIAFCREGIRPIWEDPANENGGRYLVKNFARDDTEAVFTKTALGFFSGLFHDWKNYNLVSLHVRDARRGNDIQLWRRIAQGPLGPSIVKNDILAITSEEQPAHLVVSYVPNRESLSRNDEKLAYNSGNRKCRSNRGNTRRGGPSATVESVFGSVAAARSVSSLYSKGKIFCLSAEEKERIVKAAAQEAAKMGAKLTESNSSFSAAESSPISTPRSRRSVMLDAELPSEGHSTSSPCSRRRDPIPDMLHPVDLVTPMMGYYVAPIVATAVEGLTCKTDDKLEEVANGSTHWAQGIPVSGYWACGQTPPPCVLEPMYAYYPYWTPVEF